MTLTPEQLSAVCGSEWGAQEVKSQLAGLLKTLQKEVKIDFVILPVKLFTGET
jgi:hypothetical protein